MNFASIFNAMPKKPSVAITPKPSIKAPKSTAKAKVVANQTPKQAKPSKSADAKLEQILALLNKQSKEIKTLKESSAKLQEQVDSINSADSTVKKAEQLDQANWNLRRSPVARLDFRQVVRD